MCYVSLYHIYVWHITQWAFNVLQGRCIWTSFHACAWRLKGWNSAVNEEGAPHSSCWPPLQTAPCLVYRVTIPTRLWHINMKAQAGGFTTSRQGLALLGFGMTDWLLDVLEYYGKYTRELNTKSMTVTWTFQRSSRTLYHQPGQYTAKRLGGETQRQYPVLVLAISGHSEPVDELAIILWD